MRVGQAVWMTGMLMACSGGRLEHAVDAWLLCEECVDQELSQLRGYGDKAVGPLVAAMANGPDSARIGNIRAQFAADCAAGARFRARTPATVPLAPAMDSITCTSSFVTAYVGGYRRRALIGLDSIGTPAAIDAIKAVWARDTLQPIPGDSGMRNLLRANSVGVTAISITPIHHVAPGDTVQATVQVVHRPGVPYTVTWTSSDFTKAGVGPTGRVSATAIGIAAIKACVAGLPGMCAVTPVRVQ